MVTQEQEHRRPFFRQELKGKFPCYPAAFSIIPTGQCKRLEYYSVKMLIFPWLSHRLLELPDHLLSPSSGDVKSMSQDKESQATYSHLHWLHSSSSFQNA